MATIFNDTFTGTAGTLLSAHTPDTGTSWTNYSQSGARLEISPDGISAQEGHGPASAEFSYYTADATYSSANYTVTATFSTFATSGITRMVGLVARWQDANNYYLAWIEDSAGTNDVRIYKVVAGAGTKLSSTEDTNPTDNDVFIFEVNGTQLGLKKNGSYVINPITDSSHSAAGKAGWGAGDFADITTAATAGGNIRMTTFLVETIDSNWGQLLGLGNNRLVVTT